MSKFKGIIAAHRGQQPEEEVDYSQPDTASLEQPIATAEAKPKPRGRPATGKKSNADFEQVTAYVRKDTYRDVKIKLLRGAKKQDFSDLVEDLLSKWVQEGS